MYFPHPKNLALWMGLVLPVLGGCQSAPPLLSDTRAPSSKEEVSSQPAEKPCTVCLENVPEEEIRAHKAYLCTNQHCIDRECLSHQISSLADVKDLETKGLACCGQDCKERISLTKIRALLGPEERVALDTRLAKAATPSMADAPQTDLQKLAQGIEDAFNLCCPKEGCGAVLDEVEGCNAATCSNEECKATFCYLCLKPQPDNRAAHAHVREHSGNYWERRPGYTDRYHWLIARKKLTHLFEEKIKWYKRIFSRKKRTQEKVSTALRSTALESRKALLQENNMWPMPAGIESEQWLQEVRNAHLDRDKKNELLQNEYLYRLQQKEKRNAAVIEAELKTLGVPVLATLDIQDTDLRAATQIVPVLEDDPRVSREFAALGNMYEVQGLIWSGVARRKMNQQQALQFCLDLGEGSMLPGVYQYRGLAQAMGYPNRYNSALIPDMNGRVFSVSSPVDWEDTAFQFNGTHGYVDPVYMRSRGSVRCVRVAHPR